MSAYRDPDRVSFHTSPGDEAPEVKGTRVWFTPERLEWFVSLDQDYAPHAYVTATGPATRATSNRGVQGWTVAGDYPDVIPDWINVPWTAIHEAASALISIEDMLRIAKIEVAK